MGLAILTNQTLDEMESWIVEIVSEIRNRNLDQNLEPEYETEFEIR